MPSISMKELLEAGVHFGHQTKRWNPKMKEYIFGERNGIYIIDLQKTLKLFKDAMRYVQDMATQGKTVLFVGTKRQASEPVAAERGGAKVRVFLFKDLGYNPYAGVLFTRKAYLDSHPAEVKALVEAVKAGWLSYQADPEPAIARMQSLNSTMSLETFRTATRIQQDYLWPKAEGPAQFGTMEAARWDALSNTLNTLGMTPQLTAIGTLP